MRSHRRGVTWLAVMALVLILGAVATAQEKQWWPFPVEDRDPPFDMEGKKIKNQYTPLPHAAKKWNICVSFPHMKDAYWTAVDYGVVAESKRLGVKMQLVEAGGYTNLPKQINQLEDCVSQGADAVVIGAISETGLNKLIEEIRAKGIPVIDVINGISSPKLSAKSLVSFGEMGAKAGEYLVKMHPKGAKPVKVAWFPGPPGAGWVVAGNKGFVEAVSKGAIDIVSTKYGDTGNEVQLKLVDRQDHSQQIQPDHAAAPTETTRSTGPNQGGALGRGSAEGRRAVGGRMRAPAAPATARRDQMAPRCTGARPRRRRSETDRGP